MATVTTEAQLCNLALGFVGQRQLITSLTEESTEAQLCAVYYSAARDLVLSSRVWKFATRRSVLALTTEERTNWEYVYAVPPLMLEPQFIVTGVQPPLPPIPFDIELNDTGTARLILTNEPDAELVYSAQVSQVGLYSPPFVLAVAWQLAVFLATSLPVKPALADWCEKQADKLQKIAAVHDLNTAVPSPAANAETIRTRS